jgi:phage terminase large subunit-like protein
VTCKKKLTRGERVIEFIGRFCRVPEGEHVGKFIELEDFQKKFILDIYDNPAITDTAILSEGRKNGKTALIACLVLAHTVGTEARQNSRIVSGAMSRDQASEVYNAASKMILQDERLSVLARLIPSQKKIIGLRKNVEYRALAAEAKTAYGLSPVVAILDEIGQVKGSRSDFVDAITTAQGAHKNPLLIYISTQAADDADLLSILIDDYRNTKRAKTICHVYEADKDCKLDDVEQWKKANPALGKFRSLDDMKKLAEKALSMPSFANTFRNLHLNQRVDSFAPFITRDIWMKNAEAPIPLKDCDAIYGGLDLSQKTDLTALVLCGVKDKIKHIYAYFWMPAQGLAQRAERDRAPYDLWVEKGFIELCPLAAIDYDFVAAKIDALIAEHEIAAIGYDRHRIDVLESALDRLGTKAPLVEFGQGTKSMAPAMDAVEEDLFNGRMRHGNNPVLNMCMANARVIKNAAGDRKLEKKREWGRIDGAVALLMAAGTAQKPPENVFDVESFISSASVL